MKKTLVTTIALSAVVLTGCSSNKPEPKPIPAPSISVPSESPTAAPTTTPVTAEPTAEPTTDNPTSPTSPSPTGEETPMTQFIKRWGVKYPSIPEADIALAAARVCRDINAAGAGWADDPSVVESISTYVVEAGLPSSEATEFSQDAAQNVCGSPS